jgi:hypothetical protein
MALDSKNNIKSVFIVPDQAVTATLGQKITPGSLQTGEIVVTNVGNEVLDVSNVFNVDTIKIVKDRGANLPLQQVRLNIKDVIAYSGLCGEPATEQVSFVGFDGTSGAIDKIDNNFYILKLEHVPNAFAYGKRPANYKYGTFKSKLTGATEAEIANGLQASLVQNFKPNRTIDWRVFSEIICNNAGAAITGTATDVSVTLYSKTVTIVGGTITNVVAGDFIRLGGTAVTDPVYKVAAKTATTITLTVPYQGTTGTIAIASVEVVTAALAATAAFGVKITGIKQKYDVNRWRQYDKVRFNVLLENFGTTGSTKTAAFDGIGVYEQAANDEYISWGDEGQVFVDQVPPLFREQDAVVGTQYSPVILAWLNKLPSLIGAGENKGSAIFYIENTCLNQGLNLIDVLDVWVTTAYPNIPAITGGVCPCG